MEEWKDGRMEWGKGGMVENWKDGRMEVKTSQVTGCGLAEPNDVGLMVS